MNIVPNISDPGNEQPIKSNTNEIDTTIKIKPITKEERELRNKEAKDLGMEGIRFYRREIYHG